MKHYIEDNVYYVLNDAGEQIFSVELTDMPGDQLIISTGKEVYAGPISLISFLGERHEQ